MDEKIRDAIERIRENAAALMPARRRVVDEAIAELESELGGTGRKAKASRDRKARGGNDREG